MKNKSAVIPYRIEDEKLQIMLIKNSDDTKWVIPKGTIEKPLKPAISAAKEACEEAGVIGITHPILIGTYKKNNQNVSTYLLEVMAVLEHYEEMEIRERAWHNMDEVNENVTDSDLIELIKLGSKVISKNGYYFKYAIKSFCDELGVGLSINKKKTAVLNYKYDAKNTFDIKIERKRKFLHFSMQGKKTYKELEKINTSILSKMLLDNTDSKFGYWSLKKNDNGYVFLRMYNEELSVLSVESLSTIIKNLVENYLELENIISD